jgi:O-antigen/teichoic acid export membrane protein
MFLNVLKFGLSEGLAKIAPFLTTLYVAKFLAPEEFGKYSLIVVMFEIVFIFVSFNIQATTRIDYFKVKREVFNTIKQSHLILSLCVTLLISLICFFFKVSDYFTILILAFSALVRTFSVFIQAVFQCSKRVNAYVITNVVFVFSLSIAIVGLVKCGLGYSSWLYSIAIASIIQLICCLLLFKIQNVSFIFTLVPQLSVFKQTFIAAVIFMPQAIGWWLKSGADRFLINKYINAEVLGNYALSFQFSSLQILAITTINLAVVPLINEKLKDKRPDDVFRVLALMSMFCAIFSIFIYFFNVQIISLFYKDQYLLAVDLMLPFCISNFFQALLLIYINILYYENHGKYVAVIIFINFFAQFLANYIALSMLNGTATSVIAISLFFNIIVLCLVLNRIRTIFPLVTFTQILFGKKKHARGVVNE